MSEDQTDPFDLFYYDELGRQDEQIRCASGLVYCASKVPLSVAVNTGRLTVDPNPAKSPDIHDLTPPLEHCIRTRWTGASVDWNGTEELL